MQEKIVSKAQKEKMYSDYQKSYKKYEKIQDNIVNMESEIEQLEIKKKENTAKLETEKSNALNKIKEREKDIKSKIGLMRRQGSDNSIVEEYISSKKSEIKSLEKEIKTIQQNEQKQLEVIEDKVDDVCQKLGLDKNEVFINNLNEDVLKYKIKNTKILKKNKMISDKEIEIDRLKESLKGSNEYHQQYNQKIKSVAGDYKLQDKLAILAEDRARHMFPDVLPGGVAKLLKIPVKELIDKCDITDVTDINRIGSSISAFKMHITEDELKRNMSKFKKFIAKTIVVLMSIIIFVILKSIISFGANQTIGLVSMYIYGAAIGVAIGVHKADNKPVAGGITGGLLSIPIIALIAVISKATHLTTILIPFLNFITSVILSLALTAIIVKVLKHFFWKKLLRTLVGEYHLAEVRYSNLPVKDYEACAVLLRYVEIVEYLFEKNNNVVNAEIAKLQKEKEAVIKDISTDITHEDEKLISQLNKLAVQIRETKKTSENEVNGLNRKIEKLTKDLDSTQDSLLEQFEHELSIAQKEYSHEKDRYENMISDSEVDYTTRIRVARNAVQEKRDETRKIIAELKKLRKEEIAGNVIDFDGILSDCLYLEGEDTVSKDTEREDEGTFSEYTLIKHNKKPVVFLYDIEDSSNVVASLYKFMYGVLESFYSMNAVGTFDIIITDPVSKARKFEALAGNPSLHLKIENDIHKLSDIIQTAMTNVAKTGMNIDNYNKKMYDDGEDKIRYLKYKIVEFIVPEESSAQNTNFFNSDLWGALVDGKENGFIPIFYIKYSDWVNTFDENSKVNSKFIQQLKTAIGNNDNIYKIDEKNIRIKKII